MSNSPEIGSRTRTRAIMEKYGIHTKKSFGQNFLTDLNVLKNIVEAADITANDNVIEIGPGIGALTEQSVIGKDPAVKEKMTAVLAQLDISPQIRPEKLTLEQFIELANALHQQNLL